MLDELYVYTGTNFRNVIQEFMINNRQNYTNILE